MMLPASVLLMVMSAGSAVPSAGPAPAPVVETAPEAPVVRVVPVRSALERRLPFVQSAVVGGAIGLVLGVPLLVFSACVALVATVAMTVVLIRVQDWQHGNFKLNEDDKNERDNTFVMERNAWVWGRSSLAFSVLGMGLGGISSAIGLAALLGGVLIPE